MNTEKFFSFLPVYALFFLIPIFLIPTVAGFPFQMTKVGFALLVTAYLAGWWIYRSFSEGRVRVPYSFLSFTLLLLPLAYAASAIASPAPFFSFFGYQLEWDTVLFILLGAILSHMILFTFSSFTVARGLLAIVASAVVVFLFQLTQFFFNTPFPFDALQNPITNLIGSWSDLGIFAGLMAILSLVYAGIAPLTRSSFAGVVLGGVVALFFVAITNVTEVWYPVIFFSLILLILGMMSFVRSGSQGVWSIILPVVFLVTSLFFLFFGSTAVSALQNSFNISVIEARPSFESTIDIIRSSYAESPLLGSGPHTFSLLWQEFRPDEISVTPFWNTIFSGGVSTVFTAFATGGLVVGVAWILFFVALLRALILVLIRPFSGDMTALAVSGVGVLYLSLMLFFSLPSQALLILFFIFVGFFMATYQETTAHSLSLNFVESIRARAAVVVVSVFLIGATVAGIIGFGVLYLATSFNQRAIAAVNEGSFAEAESLIDRGLMLRPDDRLYRTATLITVASMNALLSGSDVSDEARAEFQRLLVRAIETSTNATSLHPDRFENWMVRGLVFETIVPLQIEGALENAVSAFESAGVVNPKNPEVDYRLALLSIFEEDIEQARARVTSAIEKKPDYTPAIILLADIELREGNLDAAIESVRSALFFEPNNPVLLYQVGVLSLQNEDIATAIQAFEGALSLQPEYANAAFLLAQAYARESRFEEAIEALRIVERLNPENESVRALRFQLEDGVNPFAVNEITEPDSESVEGVQ